MNKKLKYSLFLGLPSVIYFIYRNYPKLSILTGFAAKNVCSCTFLAGRKLESIEAGDNNFLPVFYAKNEINFKEKSVSASIFGLNKRTAIYREGVGGVLLPENKTEDIPDVPVPTRNSKSVNSPCSYEIKFSKKADLSNIDPDLLKKAVDTAFDPEGINDIKTRAVLVLHKDKLIAERYLPGFSKDSIFSGWSMTKSLVNAVLGVMEKQGRISLNQKNLFKSWKEDERSEITLNNLLQMNSGLQWVEDYASISDVTKMLFQEENMSKMQLQKQLKGEPGKKWIYSSGSTNLLSGFIRDQFETQQEYLDFWYDEIIDKIGMNSMTIEADLQGNYVGSSYGWATARDWAKFGLLYLNKGEFNGQQLFKESWVDYTAKPACGSNKEYGAHFWLNAGGKYPQVPTDMFSCNGFQGQYIFIIPSKDLVVVRFGLTEYPKFDIDGFLGPITAAVQ